MMELVCLPLTRLVAHGIKDGGLGSYGTFCKYVSKSSLKSSKTKFLLFLISFGMALKQMYVFELNTGSHGTAQGSFKKAALQFL